MSDTQATMTEIEVNHNSVTFSAGKSSLALWYSPLKLAVNAVPLMSFLSETWTLVKMKGVQVSLGVPKLARTAIGQLLCLGLFMYSAWIMASHKEIRAKTEYQEWDLWSCNYTRNTWNNKNNWVNHKIPCFKGCIVKSLFNGN